MNSTLSITERERLLRMARAARLERSAPRTAPIEPADRDRPLALSFAQQRLWILEQLGDLGSTYHIRIRRRLRGPLDGGALLRALDDLVARHETLRTTFAEVDGVPEQRIAPPSAGFHLVEHDLAGRDDAEAELLRLAAEEARAPFDLARGPLVRGRLVRMAADDHVLLVTMHHIVSDAWSSGVFFAEFSALYAAHREGRAPELAPLPVQYADFAAWQRRWVDGEVLRRQADYWTRTLGGAPELLELPTDRPRPAEMDHAGAMLPFELDEALTAALKALAQRHGATLFMTLLAGWSAVLARLSGQETVVVGTPTAGRGRPEVQGLIGFFVNTLALRMDLSGSPTVAELLARVKDRTLDAQHHQDIPFEQIVELLHPARSLSHNPLFQVMFAWQNAPRGSGLSLAGLELGGVGSGTSQVQAQFDLGLELSERDGRIRGIATYATALFDRETVERHLGYLRRVLEEMAADEQRRVERLALLPGEERSRVVDEWNRTEAHPSDACIHARFEQQAERTPGAAAVSFEGAELTYSELDARANRLAHHLRALGVGPDVRVALCVERGMEMMVGILAILKAGGAYVPLDPAYPEDRLAFVLADSAPAAVLTQSSLVDRLDGTDVPVLALDADAPAWADLPATRVGVPGLTPDHLAYIIYTSGSTGRPKGVLVPHRNVARLFSATDAWFGFGAEDVWTLFHSVAFDFSVWEMWGALLYGGRLVIVPGETTRSPEAFYRLLCDEGVTVLNQTPSAFYQLMKAQQSSDAAHRLRHVVFGGEALDVPLLRPWFERNGDDAPRLVNMYGITETTVHVTYRPLSWADVERAGASPIGARIPDLRAYLLDAAGEPVPVGVPGELYVGGAGLARGYLGRPELTAERFVADPFGAEPGARLYRTGDLGRWRPDGTLEYLGRTDHQVKVRGFRIELGEIEARLLEHPGVREAVVLAREDAPGERRLVAYVVGDETAGADGLRTHLGERLPAYMVPAAYVRLEQWPLTANGKLDRRALPAPEGEAYAAREYEAPLGETETALAEVWSEVLGIDRVGRRDNFFDLGGHSLLAVQVIARLRQRGLHVEVRALFTAPTLADLAAQVRAESVEARVPENAIPADCTRITPEMLPLVEMDQAEIDAVVAAVPGGAANVQDVYPLAPLQEGILFHHRMTREGDPYLLGSLYSFRGRGELDAYLDALRAVAERHDILRTALAWDGVREPVQVVWRSAPLPVEEVRLDPAGGDPARQLHARFDPRHHRIDLRTAPMMRAHVAYDAGEERWLLLLLRHHLVSDHTTLEVLHTEVEAHLSGRADTLPPPLPFRNYVAQTRLGVSADEHRAFFGRMLGDVDEPTAPFGLMDVRGDGSTMAQARVVMDPALSARLRARAQALGVGTAALFHVAWAQVLARASGRDDVVFGTLLFGRMHGGEGAERVMGPFINTLPLRVRVGAAGAEESVRATHDALVALLRHEHASLALAQRCSGVDASAPLFTALLNYRHSGRAPGGAAPMATARRQGMRRLQAEERTNYPLTLSVDDVGTGAAFHLKAQVVHESLDPARVCAFVQRAMEELVTALETAPARPLGSLDVLPADELDRVLRAWNRTDADIPSASTVHALFERQAERAPDAVAVRFDGGRRTYGELNARANRLAHHLRSLGVGPDVRVALAMPRSAELVEAELAVLKCGGVYVPMDPEHPAERLREMLADSAPAAVLATGELAARFADVGVPVLAVDGDDSAWAACPATNLDVPGLTPDHLAYVMYTSGSTGRPKGVMVSHRSIVRLVVANGYADFGPDDRVAFAANPAFDATTMEVWAPLVNGGATVVIGRDTLLDAPAFARALEEHGVTALFITTAVFNRYAESIPGALAGLRCLMTGGEAADPAAFARVLAEGGPVSLIHCYGPTETTTFAVTHPVTDVPAGARTVPLGGPIGNTRVYLLDPGGAPVPVGVAGEMYIGGMGVARGYQGRPALTAERFVPDAFGENPGARLYRTGDVARWLADGALEFVGRTDHQVKVRGFRIEPGEVEARLLEHAGVREAIVLVRQDAPGEKRLVAYVVADPDAGADVLRAHLAERLPAYMVPAAYVRMDALPLTPNGKIDRRALPAPDEDAFAAREYQGPETETETALAEIWSEVLGLERVGRWDDFFELGGHSLLAVQVISRVQQGMGVEMELGELFSRPVLADLAAALETAARAELPPIQPAAVRDRVPLSFAQQRLWFLEQLGTLGGAYHIRRRRRLRGELDRPALRRALDAIVARHEALRTTFAEVDGVPEQRIAPAEESRFHLVEHDVSGRPDAQEELARLMAEEADAPFDLARGPLIRGRLVRVAADDHALLVTLHHIVGDGWSTGVFFGDLAAFYAAFREGRAPDLPPLPVQYADYATWQREWAGGRLLQEQADYWTGMLGGAPELLELPTDRPRPARMDHAGARFAIGFDEELTAALAAVSRRYGATLYMTLVAAWAVVLGRLAGQRDVVIGSPTAGRGRQEIEGLIGFFVNTLALRVDLSAATVAELLEQVKTRVLGAQQHQDIPFEQIVERVDPARSLAHHPLFQVMLSWQSAPQGEQMEVPGLAVGDMEAFVGTTAKFDLSLSLSERNGRIRGTVTYATALFDRETVERHVEYLRRVLAQIAADDAQPVERLSLLPPAERARVVEEWNRTDAGYPADACVHELFEAQVRRTPDAVALVAEGRAPLSYAELNARANRLAHHLAARGVGPDVCVGLCLERGPEMVVALFAVLKAGGAYVPLDAEYPEDRLRSMLADSAPAVLLTQSSLAERFADVAIPRIRIDSDAARWADAASTDPARGALTPDHLAYVIYTSGSTGRPKGVMNQHRALVNRLAWGRRDWSMDGDEALLCKTSLNFDGSVREIFLPLMAGGRVVLARPGGHRDPSYLLEVVGREGITTVNLVPSLLQVLLDAEEVGALRGLRRILCGGEALPGALLERCRAALPDVEVHNLYGPSEAATAVTSPVGDAEAGRSSVPIGGPSANARVYVLDGAGEPVPVGVAGELYVGGVPVARGYLGRAALTAERFVPDAFGGEPGARLYRTGDVVRWRADGRLDFVGRNDDQVKVRGFRVELGEIEARLREHPSVREAVVLVREDAPGDRRLVAWCVGDDSVPVESLRAHLSERLPEYMVPAAYVRMDALPLTPSGKLDARALPAPEGTAYVSRAYEPPVGETEEAVAAVWAEVLGVERVGRRDNFFELGGHSLLAVKVVARLRQAGAGEVSLPHVFSHPTLHSLAARISGPSGARDADRAIAVRAAGPRPPLFLVYEGGGSTAYAQVLHPHVDGGVPVYALPAPALDAPLRTVEEMAARLVRMIRQVQPEGPYRVAGWSFGGVLAYEAAAQLVAEGGEVAFVGMFDSYSPTHPRVASREAAAENAEVFQVLRGDDAGTDGGRAEPEDEAGAGDADVEAFVARLREEGRLPRRVTVAQFREMRDRRRTHVDALRGYAPRPIPVPVHLFPARDSGEPDLSRGWRDLLPAASLHVTPVPGTHTSMMRAPNAAALGRALSERLEPSGEEAGTAFGGEASSAESAGTVLHDAAVV